MNTALPQGLPRRLLIVPSNNIYMKTADAIRLIGTRRAREVYSDDGKLIGVELGHFGPAPTIAPYFALPPAELPNLIFRPPTNGRTQYRKCRLIIRTTRTFWRSAKGSYGLSA